MARSRLELPSAAAIVALTDREGRLAVRVTPGARSQSLAIAAGQLVARVREKPTDGRANAALIGLLAQALDCPPSRLLLLRGAKSRDKLVRVIGPG